MINILDTLNDIARLESETGNTPKPGSVDLKKCRIQHGDNASYDISPLVAEIHLFEDIEKLGISGWLQIRDNINLIRNGLILGEELLWLKFETAGATQSGHPEFAVDYSTVPLYIHKIEDITAPTIGEGITTQAFLEYRLHFCSTEMITNDRIRVSKTYEGTIDKIIENVMRKDLGVTRKPITLIKTEDVHHFIVPNMRPFDFILSIADKARAQTYQGVDGPQPAISNNMFKGDHADFLFFETSPRSDQRDGGWFFVPVQRQAMADAEADFGGGGAGGSDLLFTLNNSATTTGGEESQLSAGVRGYAAVMLRSLSYSFVTTGDKWLSIASGSWCGSDIRWDEYNKSFDVYKFDYLKHLRDSRYSHASETPVWWPPDPTWRKISEWPESNVMLSNSAPRAWANIDKNTKLSSYPWGKEIPSHNLLRRMQLSHVLNYERIECEMYGISGLQIGKMAKTEFPQIGKGSGAPEVTGIIDSKDVYGEDRNNNTWMITKIGHHINFRKDDSVYTTTMELANTMRTTKKTLPSYGSLASIGGPHRGEFF